MPNNDLPNNQPDTDSTGYWDIITRLSNSSPELYTSIQNIIGRRPSSSRPLQKESPLKKRVTGQHYLTVNWQQARFQIDRIFAKDKRELEEMNLCETGLLTDPLASAADGDGYYFDDENEEFVLPLILRQSSNQGVINGMSADNSIVCFMVLNLSMYNTATVDWLCTAKRLQGNGLAKHLLLKGIGILQDVGIKTIDLTASGKGLPLYKKSGFEVQSFISNGCYQDSYQPAPIVNRNEHLSSEVENQGHPYLKFDADKTSSVTKWKTCCKINKITLKSITVTKAFQVAMDGFSSCVVEDDSDEYNASNTESWIFDPCQ